MPTLNLEGETVSIKKKRKQKNKVLTNEEFIEKIFNFLDENTDGYLLYYKKKDSSYSLSDLNDKEKEEGLNKLQKDLLRNFIEDAIDGFFYEEEYDLSEDDINLIEEQDRMQEVLNKIMEQLNDGEDDNE